MSVALFIQWTALDLYSVKAPHCDRQLIAKSWVITSLLFLFRYMLSLFKIPLCKIDMYTHSQGVCELLVKSETSRKLPKIEVAQLPIWHDTWQVTHLGSLLLSRATIMYFYEEKILKSEWAMGMSLGSQEAEVLICPPSLTLQRSSARYHCT